MKLLVTGGAGFIGSAVVRMAMARGMEVVNVDCLTYAANLDNLKGISDQPGYRFFEADISDAQAMRSILAETSPDAIMNLAAETHVDRSIDRPDPFLRTNIQGTYVLLCEALEYWQAREGAKKQAFRFHHVSTDEVYGSLGQDGAFSESSAYRPNSPYSASKASADFLVRAWGETYGLPVITTNCSNNYGPFQFPEKLIPLTILSALEGRSIPVYGKGENVRDWLHVDDHASGLLLALEKGQAGETYMIGGGNEWRNIDLVREICRCLDDLAPADKAPANKAPANKGHETLISFVQDRPGHDLRYAVDASKIRSELGWQPEYSMETGLRQTVQWYLDNEWWWQAIRARGFDPAERLGTGAGNGKAR